MKSGFCQSMTASLHRFARRCMEVVAGDTYNKNPELVGARASLLTSFIAMTVVVFIAKSGGDRGF